MKKLLLAIAASAGLLLTISPAHAVENTQQIVLVEVPAKVLKKDQPVTIGCKTVDGMSGIHFTPERKKQPVVMPNTPKKCFIYDGSTKKVHRVDFQKTGVSPFSERLEVGVPTFVDGSIITLDVDGSIIKELS